MFPQTDMETDPIAIRDFVRAVEAMGYAHLNVYDHIVGADTVNRPDWRIPFDHEDAFQEPMMLFAYLASQTRTIEFSASVINLAQRQTAVFAKQAANLDIYCGGRLRLGIGTGNNPVEYEALGADYETRGRRLDDQIKLLRLFWTRPSFSYRSEFHVVNEAGLNPLPLQQPIPLWIGGHSAPAMRRAVRTGDGWMPTLAADAAESRIAEFREALAAAGRSEAEVPFENHILLGSPLGGPVRTADDAVADANQWRKVGASGVFISTIGMGLRRADEHLALFRRIADGLHLSAS